MPPPPASLTLAVRTYLSMAYAKFHLVIIMLLFTGFSLPIVAQPLVGQEDANMVKRFSILQNGNVGIGVEEPRQKLVVDGTICATEVRVSLSGEPCWWPDYVFNSNYKLRDLLELESYIKSNKHLPDIPTADEVNKSGFELGDMQARMMQKIEELTLYIIELKKENEEIKKLVNSKKGLKK